MVVGLEKYACEKLPQPVILEIVWSRVWLLLLVELVALVAAADYESPVSDSSNWWLVGVVADLVRVAAQVHGR